MPRGRNLILTGFMGTGKTTVGTAVARALGRPFVDMDARIAQEQHSTISELFARHGEPYFRDLEAQMCQSLASQEGLVIATGGGTLVVEENYRVLSRTGMIVCLTASSGELGAATRRGQAPGAR